MESPGKHSGDRRVQVLPFVYQSLVICLIALAVVIIGGTIYGIFFHTAPPSHKPEKQTDVLPESGGGQIFTGIGRIRVSTTDPHPGVVILFVSFVYNPEDKAFSEELALRVKNYRAIITDYIGSFSTVELKKLGEDSIKTELLRRFNAILRLGQIETLYFSDFLIIG